MSRERLYQMAAAADAQLKQFVSSNEEQDPRYARTAVKAGLGVAGATYGAAKLRQAAINKAGVVDDYGNMAFRKGMYKDAGKAWYQEGKAKAKPAVAQAYAKAKPAAEQAYAYGKDKIKKGVMEATKKGGFLRNTASKALRTVKNWRRDDLDRIVNLAARIEGMAVEHEFEGQPEKQRSKLGVAYAGGVNALYDQSQYKKSGLVYRKRDAVVDNFKGQLGGVGTVAGLAGAGAGAMALAKRGKLPAKLIPGFVKAANAVGRRPVATKAGLAIAGVGAGLATQHGSAEKRRKALLAQRLQGGAGA